ncbi:MAG TPA: hypothetical protein DCZ92_15410 [Elusimicrobia bacterium]|nr:MAG: hypothetical protein A2016_06655 [Elusimicrobia bacterium GWF2_62_30]HBA62167.1 hypothetical protein [Elusimicrobiota bacterium]
MTKYSVAQMREGYTQKKEWEKQFPVSYFIFRPLSFYLASFLTNFTNSPSATAYAGFFIGVSGSGLLFFSGTAGIWPGWGLLAFYALLDAADGNIARATKNVTYYGKFLDGTLGIIAEGLYLPCLAAGLYLDGTGSYITNGLPGLAPAGLVAAAFLALTGLLYSARIEAGYDYHAVQKEKAEGTFSGTLTAVIGSSRFRDNLVYRLFINLNAFNVQLLLLAAAALFRAVDIFILLLAAYYAVRFLVCAVYYLAQASRRLC